MWLICRPCYQVRKSEVSTCCDVRQALVLVCCGIHVMHVIGMTYVCWPERQVRGVM